MKESDHSNARRNGSKGDDRMAIRREDVQRVKGKKTSASSSRRDLIRKLAHEACTENEKALRRLSKS